MAMSASTLATQLQSLTPTSAGEAAVISAFVNAWKTYFAASVAGAVAYVASPAHSSAMTSGLAGLSVASGGALAIQTGVTAWWASVVSTFAATYPSATAVTPPPTLSAIAAALAPVLVTNTSGSLSLSASCTAIATVLHTNNLGGIATLPPAVPTPIT